MLQRAVLTLPRASALSLLAAPALLVSSASITQSPHMLFSTSSSMTVTLKKKTRKVDNSLELEKIKAMKKLSVTAAPDVALPPVDLSVSARLNTPEARLRFKEIEQLKAKLAQVKAALSSSPSSPPSPPSSPSSPAVDGSFTTDDDAALARLKAPRKKGAVSKADREQREQEKEEQALLDRQQEQQHESKMRQLHLDLVQKRVTLSSLPLAQQKDVLEYQVALATKQALFTPQLTKAQQKSKLGGSKYKGYRMATSFPAIVAPNLSAETPRPGVLTPRVGGPDLVEKLAKTDPVLAQALEISQSGQDALLRHEIEKAVGLVRLHPSDVGSSDVQVAALTVRIRSITNHLQKNRKDFTAKRAIATLLSQRRKHLVYLKRTALDRYFKILKLFGIRSVVPHDKYAIFKKAATA